MSFLSEARAELMADLSSVTGVKVFDYVPEGFTPPVVFVTEGDPYVSEGDTFSSVTVALTLTLVAGSGRNSRTTEAMDDLITKVITFTPDWWLQVGAPFMTTPDGTNYLACRVLVSKIINL